jgi:hypothetical protein
MCFSGRGSALVAVNVHHVAGYAAALERNMTGFGMYDCETRHMMNLELARIIQADREREIEAELRTRRLLRNDQAGDAARPAKADRRPVQRRVSTGAASR